MGYPVIAEVLLPRVERIWYRRRRREPTDVPLARPGCGYVFKAHGEYVAYDDRHLSFTDAIVVAATSVSLVDVRSRNLPVDITIPSAVPDEEFLVRSIFRCRVTDPAMVARHGLTDLDVVLASHLASDDQLGSVGRQIATSRAHEARRLADIRVRALCLVAPPDVPGVEVTIVQVDVLIPADVDPSANLERRAGVSAGKPGGAGRGDSDRTGGYRAQ